MLVLLVFLLLVEVIYRPRVDFTEEGTILWYNKGKHRDFLYLW